MPHIEEYFVSRVARRIEFFRGLLKSEIQTSDEATDLPLLPLDRPPLDCWPADLFMAAFPRVRMNPGFEPLCLFTHKDMNRSSRLAAYQLSKAPLKAHDAIVCDSDMEEGLEEYRANAGEFCGGLAERIPVLPACRDSWAQRVCDNAQPEGIPPWLHWDINSCVNDDGTAKGLFERAMLAMCSCSPVNLWHAAGFTADCVVVSGDGWSISSALDPKTCRIGMEPPGRLFQQTGYRRLGFKSAPTRLGISRPPRRSAREPMASRSMPSGCTSGPTWFRRCCTRPPCGLGADLRW